MKPQNRKRRKRRKVLYERPPEPLGLRTIDLTYEREVRERAAFDETKARRMLQHDVDEKFAKSQECGHSIGRLARQLKWDNETAARRIAAGFRFAEVVTEYNKDVLGAPNPNPPAMDMNRIGGMSTREIDKRQIDRVTTAYMAIRGALGFNSKDGTNDATRMYRVMIQACIEDMDTSNWPDRQIRDLLKALDAVAEGC